MKKIISVIAIAVFFNFNFVNAQDNKYIPEPGQQVVAGQGKGFQNGINVNSSPEDPIWVKVVGGSNGNKTRCRTKTVHDGDTTIVQVNVVNTVKNANAPESYQPNCCSESPEQQRFKSDYFVERTNSDFTGWLLLAFFLAIAGMIFFATRRQVRYDASPVTMTGPSTNPTLNGPVNLQDFRIQSGPGYANCNPVQAPAAGITQNFYGAVQTASPASEQSTFARPSSYNINLSGTATPNQEPSRH